jgi:hypothetical protein
MGVTDQFSQANEELRINLGYRLDPANADQFRTAIAFCGMERFRLCLKLMVLRGPYGPRGVLLTPKMKHDTLLALLRLTAPHKRPGTALRSPQTAAAIATHDQLDAEAMEAIARDGD